MRVRLLRHAPSNGALELAKALRIKRLLLSGSKFRPRPSDLIVNWGCSKAPDNFVGSNWLNRPSQVRAAICKLTSLQTMQDAGAVVPDFTTSFDQAAAWLAEGRSCVARTLLRGSAGKGIVFLDPKGANPPALPRAPLYTAYEPRRDEYRVHIFRRPTGEYEVVDVQMKKLRQETKADADFKVRTAGNGWVFCREGVTAPQEAHKQAIAAVQALGLDFGAVDLGWTQKAKKATVFEVNTAPGLEGTTIQTYAEGIRRLIA